MRQSNPYYVAPSGNLDAIGQGATNLASVFMNTPNSADRAKSEALAWQARGSRQDQQFAQEDREEMQRMANLFELHDPATYDPRQVMATGLRGNMDQGDLAQLFLTATGNLPGMTEEQRTGALVGSGRTLGPDQAVSMEHQGRLREENRAADAADQTSQLSRDQALASIFTEQGPEAAEVAREAMYGPPAAGKQPDPWLEAKRRADVESAVLGEIDYLPTKMGGAGDAEVPQEVYDYILPRAMELVAEGDTPAAAVSRVSQKMNLNLDRNWMIPFQKDRIEYQVPSQRDTPAQPRQPAPSQGTQPTGLPAPDARVPGQVYDTPRGPMIWVVQPDGQSGWMPAQG